MMILYVESGAPHWTWLGVIARGWLINRTSFASAVILNCHKGMNRREAIKTQARHANAIFTAGPKPVSGERDATRKMCSTTDKTLAQRKRLALRTYLVTNTLVVIVKDTQTHKIYPTKDGIKVLTCPCICVCVCEVHCILRIFIASIDKSALEYSLK